MTSAAYRRGPVTYRACSPKIWPGGTILMRTSFPSFPRLRIFTKPESTKNRASEELSAEYKLMARRVGECFRTPSTCTNSSRIDFDKATLIRFQTLYALQRKKEA